VVGEADLFALAERALAHVEGEGRATAWWERRLWAAPEEAGSEEGTRVEVVAGSAVVQAEPAPGRAHDGYDPALATLDPAEVAAGLPAGATWRGGAARTAIVSTRGVRAYEQRTFAAVWVHGLGVTAVRAADLDPAALAAEATALGIDDEPAGALLEGPIVLGPWAVAEILRRLPLGALSDRVGTRVVAPNVNLSDSPRYPGTLPRSYDAAGAPRQPTPLIQDGVVHAGVTFERPEHPVLVGGGAASLEELLAPVERGVFLPVLGRGARAIRDGALAERLPDGPPALDPLAVLAGVQALTARQRTVPPPDLGSARTAAAVVCPGLRTRIG
jgi:hypothetical protein